MKPFFRFLFAVLVVFTGPAYGHFPHDVVFDMKVSPDFHKTKALFAVVRKTPMRSTDGGETWERLSTGLCGHKFLQIAVSPSFCEDKTVYALCEYGELFCSRNAGMTWGFCSRVLNIQYPMFSRLRLNISPRYAEDRALWVCDSTETVYRSTDGGMTWKTTLLDKEKITAMDFEGNQGVFGTRSGTLFYWNGDTETLNRLGSIQPTDIITCIELPEGFSFGTTFYVGTAKSGVMRAVSADRLEYLILHDMTRRHITALDSRYTGNGRLFLYAASWNDGLLFSDDNGTTWTVRRKGLQKNMQAVEYRAPHFSNVQVTDNGTVFLGSFCGVFSSDNDGRTWGKRSTFPSGMIVGMDVSPATEEGFSVGVATYYGGVLFSNDAGASWHISTAGFPGDPTRLGELVYSPGYGVDQTLFVSTFNYILKSVDGGRQWTAIDLRSGAVLTERMKTLVLQGVDKVRRKVSTKLLKRWHLWLLNKFKPHYYPFILPCVLRFSPDYLNDQTVYMAAQPRGLFKSENGGITFEPVWEHPEIVQSLAVSAGFRTDRTLFAGTFNGLFRSQDAGITWKQVGKDAQLGNAYIELSPAFAQDQTLFVGSASGLFVSRDSGESWRQLRVCSPGTNETVAALALSPYFFSDRTLFVQIKGGDLYACRDYQKQFVSTGCGIAGAGYEFSAFRGFDRTKVAVLKFSPSYKTDGTIYGYSGSTLLRSTDRGSTWKPVSFPP